jgi:hypothetical protein
LQAISLDPTPPLAVTTLAALMGQRYSLTVARPGEARYEEAFAFSATEYRRHFDCQLQSRYPAYFCLLRGGRLLAVCGFRDGNSDLFLEQYLDEPAQVLLAQHFDCDVPRSRIVELGGFAVRRGALALPFMTLVAPALVARGFSHAVATATMPVRRCVSRLGVPFKRLAAAEECRLHGDKTRWGSYYRMRPAVIAGRIDGAVAHFGAMPS